MCSSKAKGQPYSLAAQVIQDSQGVQGFLVSHQLQEIPAGQRSIMPASVVPQHYKTPSVPQAGLVPAQGAQGGPKAELGSRVPFPHVLSWGVRVQSGAGLGFFNGIFPLA